MLKKQLYILLLFMAAFFGSAHAAPTVTCSSPANAANTSLSVQFTCSATTTTGTVTGWAVYLDNSATTAYTTPGPVSSISAPLTVAAGAHTAIVKAWDSTGLVGQLNLSFTASASASVTASCTSPLNGGSYATPLTFACTATGGTITGWEIYQGATRVFTYSGPALSSISQVLSLTVGTGQIVQVKAYNNTGSSGVYSATIAVTSSAPAPTPTPNPTINMTTTVGALTSNNTGMNDSYNTDTSWGWSSWHNGPDKWGHVSDTNINNLTYNGATTKWYMYHEPWFDQPTPTTCSNGSFTNPQGETHTHPFFDGHRCVGYNNNTDAQVTKQINFIKTAGLVGVNINTYGPDHDNGNYDAVVQRFMRLGKTYTPQFEVLFNEDGGGARVCSHGGSWSGTGLPNTTSCFDPFHYNTAYSATELRNTNCASLPWLDPSTTAVNVGNDQATCLITKHMLSHIAYYYDHYFRDTNYAKWQGRPIYTFFGDETITYNFAGGGTRTAKPDTTWLKAMAVKYFGNPVFLFRQGGGFSRAGSDGSYDWTNHESGDSYTPNSTYFSSFYNTGKSSGKIIMGGTNPSFNNREAGWGSASVLYRKCGQEFLYGLDQIAASFNSTTELPLAEIVTLNDHEEGSGIEEGLDNCWRVNSTDPTANGAPTVSGTTLNWSLNAVDPDGAGPTTTNPVGQGSQRASDATIRTVYKFRVWISDGTTNADGTKNVGLLVDNLSPTVSNAGACWTVTGTSYSLDAGCYTKSLANGTVFLYAEAVGISFTHNQLSASSAAYTISNSTGNTAPIGALEHAGNTSGGTSVGLDQQVEFSGWAADNEDGAPLNKVEIYADGTLLVTGTSANFDTPRNDVVTAYNRADFLNSGWRIFIAAGSLPVGTHSITALAYDSTGASSQIGAAITVTVTSAAPVASLAISPTTGVYPLVVAADTSASTVPSGRSFTSRVITWGDGTSDTLTGSTTGISHTYRTSGTFTASLTITDSTSATATASSRVITTAPAASTLTITSLKSGAFVYSPMRVSAIATVLATPVKKMEIYLDGVLQYQILPNKSPAQVDKYIMASSKRHHTVKVSAYDNNNARTDTSVTVYVVQSR